LFYKELKTAVTEEMWSDYVGNWQSLISQLPSGAADETGFNLELMKSDERYPIPLDIPVYLFTSIKEVEIEERFVEFNKRAFQVHLRLNKQLENDHKNLHHVITDKNSHFIYLEEPELITNEILKTINMLIDPKSIALQFNECITNADLNGLSNLMTEDHVFIDIVNNRIKGKDNNIVQAWEPFFNLYPGYQNIFENIAVRGSTVIMQGYSICSDEILTNIRAIWVAEIINNKVGSWHIYSDTKENREIFDL
jgi:ketosteroid isomerase-like protein